MRADNLMVVNMMEVESWLIANSSWNSRVIQAAPGCSSLPGQPTVLVVLKVNCCGNSGGCGQSDCVKVECICEYSEGGGCLTVC